MKITQACRSFTRTHTGDPQQLISYYEVGSDYCCGNILDARTSVSAETRFHANYDDGSISSGYPTKGPFRIWVPGIEPGLAVAKDTCYMVKGGAHNTEWAIANKVTLDDPVYIGGNFPRSEFGFGGPRGTSYRSGDRGAYTSVCSFQISYLL